MIIKVTQSHIDLTERARQLIKEIRWDSSCRCTNCQQREEASVSKIIALASEAATQGQVVGIERAVEIGKRYEAFYKKRLANAANEVTAEKVRHHKDAYARMAGAVSQATKEIAALSPDPSYIEQVRNEAATAALEQAVAIVRESLNGDDAIAKLQDRIAAIGDDSEHGNRD